MPTVRTDGPTPIPSRIGAYEIVQPLARGGMAAVYLVRKVGPGGFARHAAMKVVRPKLATDPQFRAMFLDEARLAARIMHPHVIHIEELGEHEGMLYLVMEYVPGVPLSTLMRALDGLERGLTLEMTVAIIARLAAALHAAHETRDPEGRLLNVVHRDVSPQNTLLGANGALKLIDFGIASARNRLYQTNRELVRGKLHYMSPEQLQAEAIDRRADLFSLGVMLWELLTQVRLFRGKDDAQAIQAIVRGQLPPPGAFGDVPHSIDRLVMRMLAADPNARPESARVVRAELKAILPDAFLIEDDEIASLLIATCPEPLSELPDVETAQPLNTAELSVRPAEALERHTRLVSADVGRATVAGLSTSGTRPRARSATETITREAPSSARDASTQIGVPGGPSIAMEISSTHLSSPDVAAVGPSPIETETIETETKARAFPTQPKAEFRAPHPTLPMQTPVWVWVAIAALLGSAIGVAAWWMR